MRRRILVAMVLVTALAVIVFAVPLGGAAARLYRGREVSRLERQATRAVGAVPTTGLHGTDPIELVGTQGGVRLSIYDANNVRVAGVGPRVGGTEVGAALRGRVTDDHDGNWLAVAVPIHDEEQVIGAVRAALPWDVVADDTTRTWLAMGGFGLLAVLLAAGLAWWLSSRLVVPIDGLAGLALRLGDGDFGARVVPAGVPEIDRAGGALNRTAARLGDLVARERSFAADVSHQLNTPLTSLRLALESALLTPGAEQAAIADALDEVERLQTTVTTLLHVGRDTEPAGFTPCDPGAVSAAVADRFRGALAAAGRPLRVDVEPGLGPVRCSAEVLQEILAVLVDNASRHGAGTVAIAVRGAGSGVVVEVTDEGPGVADPSQLFERRAPDAAGHGIGLALARSLAEAHGGRLQLTRSAPHPRFTVALPGA